MKYLLCFICFRTEEWLTHLEHNDAKGILHCPTCRAVIPDDVFYYVTGIVPEWLE